MLARRRFLMAAARRRGDINVADAFSAHLYTGNGSTQTITNGIDLAGKGGLVWAKQRSAVNSHVLIDTVRGTGKPLFSDTTGAEGSNAAMLSAFDSAGYTIGASTAINASGSTNVSWTFRKAKKFFDVVTWTGDGVAGRQIAHGLGIEPGMVVVKRLDTTMAWAVWHRGLAAATDALFLNTTAAVSSGGTYFSDPVTSTTFSLGTSGATNASGGQYVAYLFAHDTDPEGVIQCVSVTANGSGAASYAHGWAEGCQYVMLKASSTTGDWEVFDTARSGAGFSTDYRLRPNLSNAEDTVTRLSDSGGTLSLSGLTAGATYILMLIRGEAA